jgi:putative fibronectin/fibrinogen-binding protein
MKYAHLVQIASYLSNFTKINQAKRINDMAILIEFNGEKIIFDLNKSNSAIYKDDELKEAKIYQAPFDNVLKKRFNASHIKSVECLKDNRILKFICTQSGSYKSENFVLYLEFTGRFTNAVITDENNVIIEALRHIDNSYRKIETGEVLRELPAITIKEKPCEPITDFEVFFKSEATRVNESRIASLKEAKLASVQKKIDSMSEILNSLEDKDELMRKSEESANLGSLLLANLGNFKGYERKICLKDFDGNEIKLTLSDTPKNSANEFYARSKKLRAKALGVEIEKRNLKEKIEFFEGLKSLLKEANSLYELEILSPKNKAKQRERHVKDVSENAEIFYVREFKILVGRNEKGNINLLDLAKKDDIWLHLKDTPSAHVIIKTNKSKVPEDVLEMAAKFCVEFSAKGAGRYEVDYTKRENLKRENGANVTYTNYKTIIINKG